MAANIGKETTFLMVYPYALKVRVIGHILEAFEKKDLTITGLKCMSMRSVEFVKKHFSGPGRSPPDTHKFWKFSAEDMCGTTVVVIMLEGKGAIAKGRAVQLGEWATTEDLKAVHAYSDTIYCSDSRKSAAEDIALWFPGSDKKRDDCSKDVVFVWPGGQVQGPWNNLEFFAPRFNPQFLSEYGYPEHQTFVLIMPAAFQNRCVGETITVLERSFLYMRGLKLVDRDDIPESITSSAFSPGIVEDKFHHGVAMVLEVPMVKSIQKSNIDNHCFVDLEKEVMHYDSKLVYITDTERLAHDLTVKFFPDGFVLWPDPECRGIFEASLLGL